MKAITLATLLVLMPHPAEDAAWCMDDNVFFILPYEAYAGTPFEFSMQMRLRSGNIEDLWKSGTVGVECSDPRATFPERIAMSPNDYGRTEAMATARTTGYVTFNLLCDGICAGQRRVYIVGGPAHQVALTAPFGPVVPAGESVSLHLQILDAFDNATDDPVGRIELSCSDALAQVPKAIPLNARHYEVVFVTPGPQSVTVRAFSAGGPLTGRLDLTVGEPDT